MRLFTLIPFLSLIFTLGCESAPVATDDAPIESIAARSVPQLSGKTKASWTDDIPREPMWLIRAFSGLRDDGNPSGAARWWRDDDPQAVDNMLAQIKTGYGHGARRFFVNRPMGTTGTSHVSGAGWLTLSDQKRLELPPAVVDFLLDPATEPVSIVYFIGSELRDPRDLLGWQEPRDDEFYMLGETEPFDRLIATRTTIGGYLSLGAGGLAIDHSSPVDERQHFIRLANLLRGDPFRLQIMGEAFPLVSNRNGAILRDDEGYPVLDVKSLSAMSWVAASNYIRHPVRWPIGTRTETWPPDRETTRVYEWIYGGANNFGETEQDRRDYIRLAMRDNLIPITHIPEMFDEAMKIYHLRNGVRNDTD